MRILYILFALLLVSVASAQCRTPGERLPRGYWEWTLPRADGSQLFYYSTFAEFDPARPLAVWMQGSGYHSLFAIREGKPRLGPLSLVNDALGRDVQLLSVEKRGVAFGTTGRGTTEGATQEYLEYATLQDRAEDVRLVLAALERSQGLPPRLLVIGHSEGADVAAKVAAEFEPVTHLAFLAGGGPSQLWDFMTFIRRSDASAEEKEKQIDQLWTDWRAIKADPRSTEKQFSGHAYRRWSSYLAEPPLQNLLKARAKILIVHGSADTAVPVESADLSAVELDRAGRDFEYLRLAGADHSMLTPGEKTAQLMPFVALGKVLRRFFLDVP